MPVDVCSGQSVKSFFFELKRFSSGFHLKDFRQRFTSISNAATTALEAYISLQILHSIDVEIVPHWITIKSQVQFSWIDF
jgi:hypothetical protein